MGDSNENYDLYTADCLHKLELNYLINNGELSEKWTIWARKNIPKIKEPSIYFRPLIDYLKERDINFKS